VPSLAEFLQRKYYSVAVPGRNSYWKRMRRKASLINPPEREHGKVWRWWGGRWELHSL